MSDRRAALRAWLDSPDPVLRRAARHGLGVPDDPAPPAAAPPGDPGPVPLWLNLSVARCPWRTRPVTGCGCFGCPTGLGDATGRVAHDVCLRCQRGRLLALPPPRPTDV